MFRKLDDEYSRIQLKADDTIYWEYGYKLYSSKGDFTVDIADTGRGELTILEGATNLTAIFLIALSAYVF